MSTQELAAQVLDLASRSLPGAEVEVRVERLQSALTRFANSFIHQNVDEETVSVGLRAHRDGRTVALSTTLSDPTSLLERAAAMLALAPRDPGWPGVTAASPLIDASYVDNAVRDCQPAERAARVNDFVQAGAGLETAGYCRTSYWAGSYRNSAGQAVDGSATDAVMDGIARLNGADGVARRSSARLSDLDGVALGTRAVSSARSQANPVELPPGRYEVILQPEAVSDLLNNFALYGFNGKVFTEGRSFAELDSAQFDPAISIYDSPFEPVGGQPYDAEGTPKSRLTLVEKGITVSVTHDRRTAALANTTSTGHALAGDNWGPIPQNPGFGPGDSTLEQMIAGAERAILVADLWYTRVLDPRLLVLTGLTRNGAWLVERGEVVGPVRNFRFTQSYPQALGPGMVLAVGSEVVPQPNRNEMYNSSAPALHLASWNFTGGASG
ncbi:MAG TPA: peptidase U62 [Micromonosporaceae bacterium]|nr:peptidase U62 [Micromonosporaceae bacterium]HCU49152.1 peptidase U62 [Micromonosporaceae bacterium]